MSGAAPVPAVVLAAGGGQRFSSPEVAHKLLATIRGKPVLAWSLQNAVDAGVGPVWVVSGAVDLSSVLPEGVVELQNSRWAEGQATSLQVAIAAARSAGVKAVVVGLADQPFVPPSAWRAVAGADYPIAVATYGGRMRNPVKLSASVWDELPADGDEGARALIRRSPRLVGEVACEGDPTDIDTLEDLTGWS